MGKRKIEAELISALDRLKSGQPRDPLLAKRAAHGRLRINPMTVAREAKRSRTLIGSDKCPYPTVRELVLQASGRHLKQVNKPDVVLTLRSKITELQTEIAKARTIIASQRIAMAALSGAALSDKRVNRE